MDCGQYKCAAQKLETAEHNIEQHLAFIDLGRVSGM